MPPFPLSASPHYFAQQGLVGIDDVIDDVLAADGPEVLPGTLDLGVLDRLELHGAHIPLRLRDEIDMLHAPFVKGDGPVRGVPPDGGGDVEGTRQLHIDGDVRVRVERLGEVALDVGVIEDVVVQMMVGLHGVHAEFTLERRFREECRVVPVTQRVVGDVLDDHRGLRVVDQLRRLDDEGLGVFLELVEDRLLDAGQDGHDGFPRQPRLAH